MQGMQYNRAMEQNLVNQNNLKIINNLNRIRKSQPDLEQLEEPPKQPMVLEVNHTHYLNFINQ